MAIDTFAKVFGPPTPRIASGLRFKTKEWQRQWERFHLKTGAGWYCDGFLFLFGEGVERWQACLDAWPFLVPPSSNRMVLGRNAYGALLVLENADHLETQSVHVLDPFTVTYSKVPSVDLPSLIARALPKGELPMFLDDSAYRAWLDENDLKRIGLHDALGIKVAEPLGGKLESHNLQIEDIVEYYQTTSQGYAPAFATLKKSP